MGRPRTALSVELNGVQLSTKKSITCGPGLDEPQCPLSCTLSFSFSCGTLRKFRRFGRCGGWSGNGVSPRFPALTGELREKRTRPNCRNRCTPCGDGCDGCTDARNER